MQPTSGDKPHNGHGARQESSSEPGRDQELEQHAGIVKVIEVLAESPHGWEDAANRALEEAARSLRNVKSIYVQDMQAVVEDGRITRFRLNAKISFAVDGDDVRTRRTKGRQSTELTRGEDIMGRMDEGRRWFRGERDDERGRYDEGRGYEGRDDREMSSRSMDQARYRSESGRYREHEGQGGYYAQENWRPGEGRSQQGEYGQRGEYASYGGGQYGGGQYGGGQYEGRRQFGGGYDQSGQFAGNYGQPGQIGGGQYGQSGQYGINQHANYGQTGPYAQRDFGGQYPQSGYGQRDGGQYGQSGYGQRDYGGGQRDYGGGQHGQSGQFGQRNQYGQSDYGQRDYGGGQYGQSNQYGQRGQESEGRGQGIGEQLEQFGGAMAGRMRRMFRPPKGYKRSDERIKEDVCDQLAMSSNVDPSEIEITVHDGEVTLSGTVPERAMKWSVEQLVDGISGVKDIHNQLRVKREENTSATSGTGMGGQSTSLGGSASGTTGNRNQARS